MISTDSVPTQSVNKMDHYSGGKDTENRISILQESINFLCKHHASVLNGLYEEIENLRRANKALQFRLVMCCCSNKGEKDKLKAEQTLCSRSQEDLATEIVELRLQLDKERLRNQSLCQQVEALKIANFAGADHHRTVPKTAPAKGEKLSVNGHLTGGRLEVQGPHPSSSHTRGKKPVEVSDTSNRLSHPIHAHDGTGARILSPELNPDSSSSAILLTPKTSITAAEGFWVRPSVASLKNKGLQNGAQSPRNSLLPGTKITAVKIPVAQATGLISQSIEEDQRRELLTPTIHPSELHPESNKEHMNRRIANELAQGTPPQSDRDTHTNNSIFAHEPVRHFTKSPSSSLRASKPSYSQHIGPFLPAISKVAELGQVSRMKKTRELQRRRVNRTQNQYPP